MDDECHLNEAYNDRGSVEVVAIWRHDDNMTSFPKYDIIW